MVTRCWLPGILAEKNCEPTSGLIRGYCDQLTMSAMGIGREAMACMVSVPSVSHGVFSPPSVELPMRRQGGPARGGALPHGSYPPV